MVRIGGQLSPASSPNLRYRDGYVFTTVVGDPQFVWENYARSTTGVASHDITIKATTPNGLRMVVRSAGLLDGNFVEITATNRYVSCGTPAAVTGYVIASGNSYYLQTRSVTCGTGYTGSGCTITCNADTAGSSYGWSSISGCTIRNCGTPVAGTGYVVGTGSATTYGATYSMSCATGYFGTAASLTCQSSGSWTDQTGCTIRDCGIPSITGYVFAVNLTTTFDAVVTAVCDEGAGYLGTATNISCLADSHWSNASGCVLVDCGFPEFGEGYLITGSSNFYGSTATVSCDSGYVGASTSITCQDSGEWTDHGVCEPPASGSSANSMIFFSSAPVFSAAILSAGLAGWSLL